MTSYVENESGANLARPELFRLLSDARPCDILLIEQADHLSRLTAADWQKLRTKLDVRQVRVVAMDLPTSWILAASADDFTGRMFPSINGMMQDVLIAVARKGYEDLPANRLTMFSTAMKLGNKICPQAQ